jgi:hypothetical protein
MYVLACCKVVDTVDVVVSCGVDTYHVVLSVFVMVYPRWAFQPISMVGSVILRPCRSVPIVMLESGSIPTI